MTTLQEYAAMSRFSTEWHEPIATAVMDFLEANPTQGYSTTALCRALGFKPSLEPKEAGSFIAKVHTLREGDLGPYALPTSRKVGFKNKDGSPRFAIEWKAPVKRVLTDEEKREWMRVNDPDTYAIVYG